MPIVTSSTPSSLTSAVQSAKTQLPSALAEIKKEEPLRHSDTGEAPVVTDSKAPSEDTELSAKYAQFARKEKALRMKDAELKAREERLSPKDIVDESKYLSRDKLKERVSTDPVAALTELGFDFDQLTQAILNSPNPVDPQIVKLKAEIEEAKNAGTSHAEKLLAERDKRAFDQAVVRITGQIKNLVSSDPQFEMIKETGNEESVMELIKEVYKAEGVELSVAEACQQVEEHLLEETLQRAKLKKIQSKLNPPVEDAKLQPSTKQTMTTLTNAVAAPSRVLTQKERIERARAVFYGKPTT